MFKIDFTKMEFYTENNQDGLDYKFYSTEHTDNA